MSEPENGYHDEHQLRYGLTTFSLAVSGLQIALRELAQAARCLTIAQLAAMKSDNDEAIENLSEISLRLERAEKYADASMEAVRQFAEKYE